MLISICTRRASLKRRRLRYSMVGNQFLITNIRDHAAPLALFCVSAPNTLPLPLPFKRVALEQRWTMPPGIEATSNVIREWKVALEPKPPSPSDGHKKNQPAQRNTNTYADSPYRNPKLQLHDRHIDEPRPLKVAVIGAGIAGITAGALLPVKVQE